MKKRVIILISVLTVALAGFSVNSFVKNGDYFMNNDSDQIPKQELDKLKKQAIEVLKWNYNGIESVDFDWNQTDESGLIKNDEIPEIAMSPMGTFWLMGYVNNDTDKKFTAKLNIDNDEIHILRLSASGIEALDKNPDYRIVKTDDRHELHLTIKDIQELKKQGYTSDITFDEIKQYFENKSATID